MGQTGAYDPTLLTDMDRAVTRILAAIERGERIAVYGDYDVDGVSATALLVEVLRCQGGEVVWHIPNRFEEGYGVNNEALERLAEEGVQLVVTVDCGIRSPREAQQAIELGMEMIISDHHHPSGELPNAAAVICQKREGDAYPDKDLAGVGLAYKIAEALFAAHPVEGVSADDWLDLVALGTVADVVPLRGENRRLVRGGMRRMREGRLRQGLYSLCQVAGIQNLPGLRSFDIGFLLGPRLNAAGRIESAQAALQLLLSRDPTEAGELAQLLNRQNIERQQQTRETVEAAREMIAEPGQAAILFAFSDQFNPGVVGLAAARLAEAYYRPAVVGTIEGDVARASCRSIPEFHITRALDECRDLFVRHGGHAAAAGFTVRSERLPELAERLGEIARRELDGRELVARLHPDVEVALTDLMPRADQVLMFMDRLQPTGADNPEPLFMTRNVTMKYPKKIGVEGKHLRATVAQGNLTVSAVGWNLGEWVDRKLERVDVLYSVELNTYNGQSNVQLSLRDIRPAES